MKYAVLTEGLLRNNIGDVIQALAAAQFFPEPPCFLDREDLAAAKDLGPIFLIANGWFMHQPERFPPPENVRPFYLSFHISDAALLQRSEVIEHFRKWAPIGCRDFKTLAMFRAVGIAAYYSGCLTTTTERRVSNSHTEGIYLVDNVDHSVDASLQTTLEHLMGESIQHISHDPPDSSGTFEEYVAKATVEAERLLTLYTSAKLLITTKIHCALPCSGMGLPVVLIHPNPAEERLAPAREIMTIIDTADLSKRRGPLTSSLKQRPLKRRQRILSNLCRTAVGVGDNPLRRPLTGKYHVWRWWIRFESQLWHIGLRIAYRLGIGRHRLGKLYAK
jgi:hypothetical protein